MSRERARAKRSILHVVGDSAFGGASRIVTQIALAASERDSEVSVLTTDQRFRDYLGQRGVESIAFDVVRREVRPAFDARAIGRLASLMERMQPDIVHTHTTKGGFVGRFAAKKAGVPGIVHTVHGFAFHENSAGAYIRGVAAIERRAAADTSAVVTVSEFHKAWAAKLRLAPAQMIQAIPNGVPDFNAPRDVGYRKLRTALFTGRMARGKGIETIIDAARDLNDVSFVVAGDGPMLTEYRRMAAAVPWGERIRFPGHVSDVDGLLAVADYYVFPSEREGMSLALLEAMAAGLPIVASDIGPNREALQSGDVGLLFGVGDASGLVRCMEELATRPRLAEALGARAKQRHSEAFSEEMMKSRYMDLYDAIP